MNRSCKEREKTNRIRIQPLEHTGFKWQDSKPKPREFPSRRERRRSTVIDKVKEISGLDTFDKALNGKLCFVLRLLRRVLFKMVGK